MSTQTEVNNAKANEIIENYNVSVKNSANLQNAQEKNSLEISETVSDLVKSANQVFPECRNWKFGGQTIKAFIYFQNGDAFTSITFKRYEGKVETLAKTLSTKVFNTFSTLRGKGKMNIILDIDGEVMNIKTGRVYHMSRKNMQRGISALTILQSYAYLKESH
jgi:hypothetical protein